MSIKISACSTRDRYAACRCFDIVWRIGGQKSHLEFHQVHTIKKLLTDFRDQNNATGRRQWLVHLERALDKRKLRSIVEPALLSTARGRVAARPEQ